MSELFFDHIFLVKMFGDSESPDVSIIRKSSTKTWSTSTNDVETTSYCTNIIKLYHIRNLKCFSQHKIIITLDFCLFVLKNQGKLLKLAQMMYNDYNPT